MVTYEVKLRDNRGKIFVKTMSADSLQALKTRIREDKYIIVGMTDKSKDAGQSPLAVYMDKFNSFAEGKVKLKDLTVFSRQFATMINAGVSMVRSLDILAGQTGSKRLARAVASVKAAVEEGQPLSDSMAKHGEIFNNLYIGMVRAGEMGGVLDSVLGRVSTFLEAQNRLNHQVKSAMSYPLTVMFFALTISFAMLKFIVPMFAGMFEQMGAKLPAFTQILVDFSNFLGSGSAVVALAAIVAAGWGVIQFKRTPQGAFLFDQYALKLPILGDLTRKVAVARFTRTLGTLLQSGVPLMGALEIVRDSIGNMVVAAAMEDLRIAVSEGEGLCKPLEKARIFPAMVVQMVGIGEETGAISAMLEKIADFYDEEVEAAVKGLTSMLEPLMMVLIGGIVGSIVVGMYLPIFDIVNKIK